MLKMLEKWFAWLTEGTANAIATGFAIGVERGLKAVGGGQAVLTEEPEEPETPTKAPSTNGPTRRGRLPAGRQGRQGRQGKAKS